MPGWQRIYITVCSAVTGFALAYVLCDYSGWPRLTYFPYQRDWRLVAGPPGAAPMGYVGTILWGLGGALCGGAVAYAACRLVRRSIPDRWLRLAGAWTLTAFVYAGLYYTWNLWPF